MRLFRKEAKEEEIQEERDHLVEAMLSRGFSAE